jgi:hypothetical protein
MYASFYSGVRSEAFLLVVTSSSLVGKTLNLLVFISPMMDITSVKTLLKPSVASLPLQAELTSAHFLVLSTNWQAALTSSAQHSLLSVPSSVLRMISAGTLLTPTPSSRPRKF